MKSVRELLDELHIQYKGRTTGNFKTTCPHCSHTRKHKSDPCLSVRIDDSGVGVNCFNCGWKDGKFYDGSKSNGRTLHAAPSKITYSGLLAKARGNWAVRPNMQNMQGGEKH